MVYPLSHEHGTSQESKKLIFQVPFRWRHGGRKDISICIVAHLASSIWVYLLLGSPILGWLSKGKPKEDPFLGGFPFKKKTHTHTHTHAHPMCGTLVSSTRGAIGMSIQAAAGRPAGRRGEKKNPRRRCSELLRSGRATATSRSRSVFWSSGSGSQKNIGASWGLQNVFPSAKMDNIFFLFASFLFKTSEDFRSGAHECKKCFLTS